MTKLGGRWMWLAVFAAAWLAGCSQSAVLGGAGNPYVADDSLVADAGKSAREEIVMEDLRDLRDQLVERQDAVEEKFSALETQVTGLNGRVKSLSRDLTAISDRLAEAESTLNDLAQGPSPADLKSRLGEVSQALGRLRTRLDTDLVPALEQRIAAMSERLGRLEQDREEQGDVVRRQTQEVLDALGQDIQVANAGNYGVHLVSYRDRAAVQSGWQTMKADNPDLFDGLRARVDEVRLDDFGGRFYRLIVGPFNSASAAGSLCARARARDLFCEVQSFDGEAI